jgi:LysM repeat protein
VTRNHGQSMVRLPGPPSDAWDVQLASRPHTVLPDVVVHKVRRGETLSRIARKYGVSISDIKSLPENRRLSSKLKIGQRITVPLQSPVVVPATYEQAPKKVESAAPANGSAAKEDSRASFDQQIHYTVHRGESLGKIARRLGISVDEICRQNNIRNRNHVYPGQRLTITVPGGSMTASDRKTYTVQRGDTINSIARRHGQQPQNLMDWNNLRSSRIYPGQELIISN